MATASQDELMLVAGSYERLLYGLSCRPENGDGTGQLQLRPVFAFSAHMASIRAVASSTVSASRKLLVSGGADETIKVWDLRRLREVGSLEGDFTGSISSMSFARDGQLLLVALADPQADSTIAIYRVKDWTWLRALKGHKGRVNCVDAHVNGRVALSVGQDGLIRMWDLVAGKSVAAYRTGLKEMDVVRWSTTGDIFGVVAGSRAVIYKTDMSELCAIETSSRIHDVRFGAVPGEAAQFVLLACEDNKVRAYKVASGGSAPLLIAELSGHTRRVKMMEVARMGERVVVCTVSSDGRIHVYDVSRHLAGEQGIHPQQVEPAAGYDTQGTRLTCLCVAPLSARAKDDVADDDSSDEDDEDDESGEEEDT